MKCQAILIMRGERKGATRDSGSPCNEPAIATRNGRHVCWLHKGAIRPIQFDDMATEQSEAAE